MPWYGAAMPVQSTHPDYDATLPAWLRARDVIAGEDAVKERDELKKRFEGIDPDEGFLGDVTVFP